MIRGLNLLIPNIYNPRRLFLSIYRAFAFALFFDVFPHRNRRFPIRNNKHPIEEVPR